MQRGSDLVRTLDVQPDGPGRYVGRPDPDADRARRVVEGSQMLGQALVAAARQVPGRRPVSAWMGFLRVADTTSPLSFELDEQSNGRTFSGLAVRVRQGDRLCATGNLLLDATAADVIRHHAAAPDVAGPDLSEPYDLGVAGQEVRFVERVDLGDPLAPAGPPQIDAWVRFHDVPDDPALHVALLAQFTGNLSIAAALRPHRGYGQDDAHRTLSTAVNAIGFALHAEVRADRWMLYHHRSTFAGDGMTHSECRVHDLGGDLLASFSVDGMVRTRERSGRDAAQVL